jgi:hypothetical protein
MGPTSEPIPHWADRPQSTRSRVQGTTHQTALAPFSQVPGHRGQSIRAFNQAIQMVEEHALIGCTLDWKGGLAQ